MTVSHYVYVKLKTNYGEIAGSFVAERDIGFALNKPMKIALDEGFTLDIATSSYSWAGDLIEIYANDIVCSDQDSLTNWKRILWDRGFHME